MSVDVTLRWAGIDAPERYTEAGKKATAMVVHWLPVGSTCEIETVKSQREKFGRYLAVFIVAGENLNQKLVDLGHAVPYDGGPR
ncbi:thermonuclease family protein [Nocardioides sp.]|uniref:thermonuclease family protein n=1 Tax=Nocardioides sp. TaxID=35761 RepID=UPI002CC2C19E|nr:thermonuclease family protein [Nocardioides sp.]HXH79505.1 thermonuclease family protein [Nocardioides sp.]